MRPSSHNPATELHNLPEHKHQVATASRQGKKERLTDHELTNVKRESAEHKPSQKGASGPASGKNR